MKLNIAEWTDTPPAEQGRYFVWESDIGTRLVYVAQRPGHAYLCIQEEPRGYSMKREFRAVAKMRNAKWSGPYEIPTP